MPPTTVIVKHYSLMARLLTVGGRGGVSLKMNVDHLLAGELFLSFLFQERKRVKSTSPFFFSSRVRLEGINRIVSYFIFRLRGGRGDRPIHSISILYFFLIVFLSC